jgi:alpha-ketoglutarate-dependent taurine dioxygenase
MTGGASAGTATPVPLAWTADTVDGPGHWFYELTPPFRCDLREAAQALAVGPGPMTEAGLPPEVTAAWAAELAPVRDALDHGRGFAIVDGVADPEDEAPVAVAAYWLLGSALGRPVAQNVAGTLLYDVRDEGGDLSKGARFSVTSAESGFHTDNSFGEDVVDTVGLLCLRTAKSGGVSQLVSGHAVVAALVRENPDALDVLRRPFHVDRRGGVRPGESPTALRPVVEGAGPTLTVRYLRHWIEAGHAKAGQPLSPEQVRALDALDEVLRRPGLRVEFPLIPGQAFLLNNRRLLHNRTAFEDHADPAWRRHYVRLWLRLQVVSSQ